MFHIQAWILLESLVDLYVFRKKRKLVDASISCDSSVSDAHLICLFTAYMCVERAYRSQLVR